MLPAIAEDIYMYMNLNKLHKRFSKYKCRNSLALSLTENVLTILEKDMVYTNQMMVGIFIQSSFSYSTSLENILLETE